MKVDSRVAPARPLLGDQRVTEEEERSRREDERDVNCAHLPAFGRRKQTGLLKGKAFKAQGQEMGE